MKTVLSAIIILSSQFLAAQELSVIFVNDSVSTHFLLSEPVSYVDLSAPGIVGDLPGDNIVRIKPEGDDCSGYAGILTIVTQGYMVQYRLEYSSAEGATKSVRVSSSEGIGLVRSEFTLPEEEIRELSMNIKLTRPEKNILAKEGYLELRVNHLYVMEDYLFLDITFTNKSNLAFDTDGLEFHIEDKRVMKATNFQRLDIEPHYQLSRMGKVKKSFRNVYVFKKFSFPSEKIFRITITEKIISGRKISIEIPYKKILRAETFEAN